MKLFKPLTQIAYIPLHAEGDIAHPDVQFGFVTSQRGPAHFCRYWRKGHPGELRTLSASELTPDEYLVEFKSVHEQTITEAVRVYGIPLA